MGSEGRSRGGSDAYPEPRASDLFVGAAKVGLGLVPVVGGAVSELLGQIAGSLGSGERLGSRANLPRFMRKSGR